MAKDTFHVVPHNEEWWVKREGHDQPASTLYPIGNADCFLVVNGWGNSPRGGWNAAGHSASLSAHAPTPARPVQRQVQPHGCVEPPGQIRQTKCDRLLAHISHRGYCAGLSSLA